MITYLMAHGFDIWSDVKNGYKTPTTPLVDTVGKRLNDNNYNAMNTILCCLEDLEYVKAI